MALDLLDGVFYRPVFSEEGYGGTRYLPVTFSLQALFITITGNTILSGYCVVFLSGLVMFLGLYRLLRELGVQRNLAICGLGFALSSIAMQIAMITFQGDFLPAGLNIWGLAFVVMALKRHPAFLAFACVAFGLAFMSKITTVFGAGSSFFYLLYRREFLKAGLLTAGTAVVAGTGMGTFYVLSDGRILDAFRATATGGMTYTDFLRYPLMIIRTLGVDFPFTIVAGCAVAGLYFLPRRVRFELPTFMLVFTGFLTAGLFLSPGVEFNHLVDVHLASVVFLVANVSWGHWRGTMVKAVPLCVAASAVIIVVWNVVWVVLVPDSYRLADRRAFVEQIPAGDLPVLSEDPFFLTMNGERPFMLDAFALHQVVEHDPRVREDLFSRLEERAFRAVVLGPIPYFMHKRLDLRLKGKQFYGGFQFCDGFLEQLQAHYEPVLFTDLYVLFIPKHASASPADASPRGNPVG
ncbi:MAG: hypothetical protein AMXMBFR84_47110 [Candidatus Hydrogenedentota bacterium]